MNNNDLNLLAISEEEIVPPGADNVEYVSPEQIKMDQGEYSHHAHCHPHNPQDPHPHSNPMHHMNAFKGDPKRISILKRGDNYYVDFSDLKRYMHSIKSSNYDSAVDSIVRAHDTSDPNINKKNLRVIMGSSDLQSCTQEEISNLESTNIQFDVYE